MESRSCFMCGQNIVSFLLMRDTEGESQLPISYIICKHFWFDEDVLQTAIICEPCWQKVNQFHRFYQEVKQQHDQLLQPNAVFIKQEQIEFEVELLGQNGPKLGDGVFNPKAKAKESEVDEEIQDECVDSQEEPPLGEDNQIDIEEERNELSIEDKSVKNLTKRKIAKNRAEVLVQKKQMQESLIKKHRAFDCDECSSKFENFLAIRGHMSDVHSKSYIMCCNAKFTNRTVLHQHVQSVFNPETFKCEFCGKSFPLRLGYIRHKQRVHRDENPSIMSCDQCRRTFTTKLNFERHMARHETAKKEKPTCDLCGKSFKSRPNLKTHIDAVHEKNPNYVCEICSKPFSRRWMFLEHQLSHKHTEEQLKKQCPICKRWQKNERYWKKHVTRHQSEGKHKCAECDHVSINLAALKVHVERRHQKNTSCVCDLCGKVYSHPVTLREHVANAHTGEPLYKCLFCEMKFFSNATMYSHRKKAHPEEWQEYTKVKYGNKEMDAAKDGSSAQ